MKSRFKINFGFKYYNFVLVASKCVSSYKLKDELFTHWKVRQDVYNSVILCPGSLPEGERELHIKRGNTNATEDNSSKSDFYAKYIWKRVCSCLNHLLFVK